MLDFDAETKFPYGSKASVAAGVLGHNLIHRFCGELGITMLPGYCRFFVHCMFFQCNQPLETRLSALRTSLSTFYVHSDQINGSNGLPKNAAGVNFPLNSKTLI
jgi:hypothetical protein